MKIPGIYIVVLHNDEPISVNAHDQRVAERAIKVTKANCKFGKTKDLQRRRKDYYKTFGEQNVTFIPVAQVEDVKAVEKAVKLRLQNFMIRGRTGRRNEWLERTTPCEVKNIALTILAELGVVFRRLDSV